MWRARATQQIRAMLASGKTACDAVEVRVVPRGDVGYGNGAALGVYATEPLEPYTLVGEYTCALAVLASAVFTILH